MSKAVKFRSGATRSGETTFDPSGFIAPIVLVSFCRYMEKHRKQADGKLRDSDNWQKGMPTSRAWRSLTRHFLDAWLISRGYKPVSADCETVEDALHAIIFNVSVILKNRIDGNDHEQEGRPSTNLGRWLHNVVNSEGAFLVPEKMAKDVLKAAKRRGIVRKIKPPKVRLFKTKLNISKELLAAAPKVRR